MDKELSKGIRAAGAEAYKNLTAGHRITSLVGIIKNDIAEMVEAIGQIEANELENLDQSSNRIIDILTLMENHVFLASTDSAFLIEVLELLDNQMIEIVLDHLDTKTLMKYQNAISKAIAGKE